MMELLDKNIARRYLLGKLSEQERDAFEQAWFEDKAKYYEMCEAENNLIDEFVRGQLNTEDRILFEQNFLTLPARRDRVATAKSFLQEIDQQAQTNPASSLWERFSTYFANFKSLPAFAIAAALLLLAIGIWLYKKPDEKRVEIAKTENQNATPQPMITSTPSVLIPTPTPITTATKNPPTHATDSRAILPLTILLRDGESSEIPAIKLGKSKAPIKLQAQLPANDYKRFEIILRSAEGIELQRWRNLQPSQNNQQLLEISIVNLTEGDYFLIINGVGANGEIEELQRKPFLVRK